MLHSLSYSYPLHATPPLRADEAYPLPSGYFSGRRLAAEIDIWRHTAHTNSIYLFLSLSSRTAATSPTSTVLPQVALQSKLSYLCTEAIGESTRVHPNAWLTVGRYDPQRQSTPWGRTRHRITTSVGSRTCWRDTIHAMFTQMVPSAPSQVPIIIPTISSPAPTHFRPM